jgi:protein involved in polysaccharide export with SLBB domain
VLSAILALLMVLPSGVPLASAQTPGGQPSFGGIPATPGLSGTMTPYGIPFGQDGTNYQFTPQQPTYQWAPQTMPPPQPPPSRVGPSTPGLCTSQTYQTLSLPRPEKGGELRTVAATVGSDTVKAEAKKGAEESGRPDLDALSPVEAAYQVVTAPGQTIGQVVFDPPRPSQAPEPLPYVPVSSTGLPVPPPVKAPSPELDASRQPAATGPTMAGPGPQAAAPLTRFLGPFGAPLRQYGYAVFSSYVSTFAPVDDVPVGPDYVVGPGDVLTIAMWGPLESNIQRLVDRNGQIALPKVGDLRVWGLTFAQADRVIREQLSRYFRGFQTSVTMGRLRTLRVQVIGEVCQPGSYTLNSLATLTQALYAAGGPTKLGSLRNVRLLRNSHVVGEVDLYDFTLRGDRTRDYRLEAGDTIFVPTIGDVAAIAGEVKRPAIYEVKGDVRLADLVETAGGATPTSYLKRVQIVRAQPSSERVTVDVDLSSYYLKGDMDANPPIHGGDLILIHKNENRIYNTVKLEGAVKYPGVYELKPMMRLSHLVRSDQMLPESYVERVEIARRRPDYSMEVLSVNLKEAWEGNLEQDPLLRTSDEVTVRTAMRSVRTVTLTGQVQRPGTYVIADGERLSSVLERAGGFTARASMKGAVFTRASLRRVEQEQLNAFVRVQEQRILSEAATTVAGSDKEGAAVDAAVVQARRDFLRALASRVAIGRMVIKVDAPGTLKGTTEDIVLSDGDALDIPEPVDSVLVLGSVRSSTSVLHAPGAGVDYYVARVGGYSKEAEKKEIHIVKADGSAVAGFANIRTVEPGDTIIVPRNEDAKIRLLPAIRDGFSIMGSTLSTVLSLAALAVLF